MKQVRPLYIITIIIIGIALGIFTIGVGIKLKSGLYSISPLNPILTVLGIISIALLLLGLFLMLRKGEAP